MKHAKYGKERLQGGVAEVRSRSKTLQNPGIPEILCHFGPFGANRFSCGALRDYTRTAGPPTQYGSHTDRVVATRINNTP